MFAFKLAAHLHKTVKELHEDIDPSEWPYWMAIYYTEGFADDRADNRANLLINCHRTKAFDFFPNVWISEEDKSVETKINMAFQTANKITDEKESSETL